MSSNLYRSISILIFVYCSVYIMSLLEAQQFSQPQNLSVIGQNASSPQVAIDPLGNAVAVWHRFDGDHLVIQASTKPFGGNWQTVPDNLSLPDQDAFNPQIAIDSLGNVVVVWERFNGTHIVIQALIRAVGGRWQSQPDQLSLSGQNTAAPQIGIDSFGYATVVWQAENGNHSVIQASTKTMRGGWQVNPDTLSLPEMNSKNPQIIVDAYDTATVVWQASNGMDEVIQVSTKLFQENWQPFPDTLCPPALGNAHPHIGADPFGNVTVVWNQFNGDYATIQASTKFFGGDWQRVPDVLSLPGRNTFSPQVAVDPFGNVTAVWEFFDAKKIKCIQASTKKFGARWQSTPDHLSISGDHSVTPQIAIDSSGNTLLVWSNFKGFTRIHVSRKSFGGNWQSFPDIISSPERSAFFPQAAFDPIGRAVIVWVMQDSLSFIQSVCQ